MGNEYSILVGKTYHVG